MTVDVIYKAVDLNANLIISHESITFGDEFSLDEFGDDFVLNEKMRLLKENGIVVYRDHDHIHGQQEPFVEKRLKEDFIHFEI